MLTLMPSLHLLAESVTGHHDPVELGAIVTVATAFLTLFGTLGKLVLNKFDKFQAAFVKSQETQIMNLRTDHHEQMEMMQTQHAAQIEMLTGIAIDAQRALTALTVQIDRYTREMHDLAEAINGCPGVVLQKEQQRNVPVLHH